MQATADTLHLSPPAMGSGGLSLGLALAVHGLLLLALAWGVNWQRDTTVVMEAELWSSLPQIAAPKAQAPEPELTPAPTPPPPVRAPEATPPSGPSAAEIALQRQREQEKREAERQREAQRQAEAAKRLAEQKAAEDKRRAAQLERERLAREQAAAARQQAQLEAERQKNLERMMGQANANGSARSTGTAAVSSGPSPSYGGRLVARIKPNIVFTETLPNNPRAEVEVRSLPDGTVLSARLLQSSGHTGWDTAVLRAVERTGKLPQDENGRVPPTLILGFRPQD
jgi:colicin import membrane protein